MQLTVVAQLLVLTITLLVAGLVDRSVRVLEEVAVVLRVGIAVISFFSFVNIELANAFFNWILLLLKPFGPELLVFDVFDLLFLFNSFDL